MKYLILPLLVLPALLMSLLPSAEPDPGAPTDTPALAESPQATDENLIVLELFTSQGCSSCPSADALLQQLDATHEEVIALSFHVDYWNYLGWEDPFSSPYYSARQTDYTEVLQERTYTPQLIVNGAQAMIGSRKHEVEEAIATASAQPLSLKPTVDVTRQGAIFTVDYSLPGAAANQRVTALLVQPAATSMIKRGENRGRELHHVNVVRAMAHQPAATAGALTLTAPEGFDAPTARVVLLVQDTKKHTILGAVRAE